MRGSGKGLGYVADAVLARDIYEVNLAYLVLAQRLVRAGLSDSVQLALSEKAQQMFIRVNQAQLERLARSPMLACRFHLNVVELLTTLGPVGADMLTLADQDKAQASALLE